MLGSQFNILILNMLEAYHDEAGVSSHLYSDGKRECFPHFLPDHSWFFLYLQNKKGKLYKLGYDHITHFYVARSNVWILCSSLQSCRSNF
jgi:hypothetical protein